MYGVEKVWFREARHIEDIEGTSLDIENKDDWRKIRERMKTVSVALVLCLNIGVDPPDVEKPNPCGRKQAWIEPNISNPQKSAQKIALNLQRIYEKLQPRARYKSAIDPTVDTVKKLCTTLRKNAKDERVLFHFNGHGVPKPTEAGEIWVFNKNITQYIPLSLYDLQSWMGVPSVYLWDCSSAGTIVNMFMRLADDHSARWAEDYRFRDHYPSPVPEETGDSSNSSAALSNHKESVQLGACIAGENLPYNPDLPADLFTCCLTTPIQTSFLCHMLKTGTKHRFPPNIIDEIPGVPTDRRTLLGELNWIFTAITDTIAWSSLPMETFQKLFRQDLLIASLFRNFLLAERIMLENGCHVVSQPFLPSVYAHPFWEYWDHTLDICLSNLYELIADKGSIVQINRDWFVHTSLKHNLMIELSLSSPTEAEYSFSSFFIEQLQAFEVWLMFGIDKKYPPQQLPVLLQVLLSQAHRVRALELLARFVDLGSWAVVAALSVGIFPYVLKLLQCGTKELRPALAFIWAKILSVDPVCQNELIKDHGFCYFLQILEDNDVEPRLKIVPAFVTAMLIYNNYRPAQEKLIQSNYVSICINLLSEKTVNKCNMLCLWLLIGLGRLWVEYEEARWLAIRNVTYERVEEFLSEDVPEVRAAAVYALGCFVHNRSRNNEHATTIDNEVCDLLCERCCYDGSVLVRAELASAIQWFLLDFESRFLELCVELDKKINVENILPKKVSMMKVEDEDVAESVNSLSAPKIQRSFSSIMGSKKRDKVVSSFAVRKRSLISHTREPSVKVESTAVEDDTKQRIFLQMQALESKTFNTSFERIWLSLLRLCFDPIEQVSKMCIKLVSHIFELSSTAKSLRATSAIMDKMHEKGMPETSVAYHISNSADAMDASSHSSSNAAVKFMIGSPGAGINNNTSSASGSMAAMTPIGGQHSQLPSSSLNARNLSAIENAQKLHGCMSMSDMLSNGLVETSSSTFTPKRNIFGSQSGRYSASQDADPSGNAENDALHADGIVSTKFVEWCSKTFTQPIYKTIYEEASISLRNSLVDSATPFTLTNPTDWALHTHEGLKQKFAKELESLKSRTNQSYTSSFSFLCSRPPTSLAWSYLRPHIYVCDGNSVMLLNTSESTSKPCGEFLAYGETLIQDSISDMFVVNELTHELLVTGTRNGLIKVWDPMFSEHSYSVQGKTKLISCAFLLNGVPRIANNKKKNETLYQWDQNCGRIACSGNVRICRLWDAWAEKSVLDLQLKNKNHFTTSISLDLNCNLICCGFADGTFSVYDARLPPDQSEIMSVREFSAPVVSSSVLLDNQRVVVISRDGDVRVWEPRMFREPVVDFNAIGTTSTDNGSTRRLIVFADVQRSGQVVACGLNNSTIRLFDTTAANGNCLAQIQYAPPPPIGTSSKSYQSGGAANASSALSDVQLAAIRFHPGRMLLGLATKDSYVSAYTPPSVG